MNPSEVYKFCPRCTAPLEIKGSNFLSCAQCKNHIFINASAAVGLIIENDKGEILLAIRAHDPYKGQWDIPGGFIMPYETIEEAAIREAEEELGVKINPGNILYNSHSTYLYQEIDVPILDIFISATIESGDLKANDDVTELHFVPKKQVLETKTWSQSVDNALRKYIDAR